MYSAIVADHDERHQAGSVLGVGWQHLPDILYDGFIVGFRFGVGLWMVGGCLSMFYIQAL